MLPSGAYESMLMNGRKCDKTDGIVASITARHVMGSASLPTFHLLAPTNYKRPNSMSTRAIPSGIQMNAAIDVANKVTFLTISHSFDGHPAACI